MLFASGENSMGYGPSFEARHCDGAGATSLSVFSTGLRLCGDGTKLVLYSRIFVGKLNISNRNVMVQIKKNFLKILKNQKVRKDIAAFVREREFLVEAFHSFIFCKSDSTSLRIQQSLIPDYL